jgi:hypothetical protein
MSKCNCVEEKRLFYNDGWANGNRAGLFDGKKQGAVEELEKVLKLLNKDLKTYEKWIKNCDSQDNVEYEKGLRDKNEGIIEFVEKRLAELK